jgi:heme oxygenase
VIETELRAAADRFVTVEAVLDADRFHEPRIRADLAFFGVAPESVEILAATEALGERVRETARRTPAALVGMFYVLESSTNGSRFIASTLRRAYDLEGDRGLTYLDPYGDAQPDRWHDFTSRMTRIAWAEDDGDAMVEAAGVMSRGIAEISDAVAERAQVEI